MATLWPGTLPTWEHWEVNGYTEKEVETTIRSEPDAGAMLIRKRFSAAPRQVSGTMILTATQRSTLATFYSQYAATRFTWNDARGAVRYYNFASPPSFTPYGPSFYRVALDLVEFTTETGAV